MRTWNDDFVPAVEPAEDALDAANGRPVGRCFAFVGAELLVWQVGQSQVEIPTWHSLNQHGIEALRQQYLGTLNGEPCWTAEIASDANFPANSALSGLRPLFDQLSEAHYALAGRAAQIVAWERDHQFCGRCGNIMEQVPNERARRCPVCHLVSYPRISPAIIVLIERGDRILLARGHAFAAGRFGIVAGFVEPGESLEDAVRREVREEVSIEIDQVEYYGSQPWPFPHGIMIGFRARHRSGEIVIDEGELTEAGWYGLDELPTIPTKLSIARRLIDDWASRHNAVIDQP